MFKKIFNRDQVTGSSNSNGAGAGVNGVSPAKSSSSPRKPDKQSSAEGFLCPTCMKSFGDADQLQQHFTIAHAEPVMQVPVDKELELMRMQLTASEESRSLLSSELMNMQRQLQEMALNQPEPVPDQSAEVKRLETQVQLLQIENTEAHEKHQLAEKSIQSIQEGLNLSLQEQKTLTNAVNAEKEKYTLMADQLTQEKQRSNALQGEFKKMSDQLRRSEVTLEQLRAISGRADEMQAKLSGKEELCRSLEQQINDFKQNSVKYDSEISQLKKSLETKEEAIAKSSSMHNEMKTAMESKIQSMEALIQEKTTSLDRILMDNEQLQHKTQTLEGRLNDTQSELTEANKKYDDLHQNFVQRIDAGEGTNVIVTQLKEDNARIQEKLKHTEERLLSAKEDQYQKSKGAEVLQKETAQNLATLLSENEELKAAVTKLENCILDLESEREQLMTRLKEEHSAAIAQLQSTISTQEETTHRLNADIATKQEVSSQLTSKLDEAKQQLSSLQNQLSDYEVKAANLEEANITLSTKLEERVLKVSTLTTNNGTLSEQLSEKSTTLSNTTHQLATMTEKMEQKTSELVSLQQTFHAQSEENEQDTSGLKERITSLESDLKSSEELLQEKLSAMDQLQEDSAVLNELILELKEQLTIAKSDITTVQSETSELHSVVSSLEVEKVELGRETERLQGLSDDHLSQFSSAFAELENARQVISERDTNLLQLQQQIDTQTKEGENLQSSLLEQIDKMQLAAKQTEEAKQSEVSKLNSDVEELRSKAKKLTDTNAALAKERAVVVESLTVTEKQLSEVQKALDSSRLEANSLQQEVNTRSENHSHVLQETTEILQRTSDENEALNRALAECKAEMTVVEDQLETAQKNSDDWQSKHRLLQDEIETIQHALTQEKTTSEETKQLLISHRLETQSKQELLEEEKLKLEKELAEVIKGKELVEQQAEDNLRNLEATLTIEKSNMEELEAKLNMQLVSLSENLSLNKTDLTATQEKLMDVVKHNDELRGVNLELETKLESSREERTMLWNRCISSETETKSLRDEKEQLRLQIENLNSALHELGRENQSLQIKTTKAKTRKWVEDDDVADCANCAKSFNVRVRKHHCRNCGNIFCQECSSKQLLLAVSSKPSRVCDNCYVELKR